MSFHELSGLMHELSGFMLLLTSDGKLLYLSDNVADHLGHCMVSSLSYKLVAVVTLTYHTLKVFLHRPMKVSFNVTQLVFLIQVDLVAQSDSVYDIINPMDHYIMRSNIAGLPMTTTDTGRHTIITQMFTHSYNYNRLHQFTSLFSPLDRLFRCRFNTTKFIRRQGAGNKLMLVRARCLTSPCPVSAYWTSNPVWVCFCTPLKTKTSNLTIAKSAPLTPPPEQSFLLACFHSQHHRDMRLWDAQDR